MRILLITGKPVAARWQHQFEGLGYKVVNGSSAALKALGVGEENSSRELTESELGDALQGVEVYIYGGLEPASHVALKRASELRLISFMGTGWSDPGCVDPKAAADLKIRVSNTPHANAASVAEFAVAAILGLARKSFKMAQDTECGEWSPLLGVDISGKTAGIVGAGAIGSLVARHLTGGFGMRVLYFGPNRKPQVELENGARRVDTVAELFAEADVVTVHAPANNHTFGMVGETELQRSKGGVLLVNLAAPEIVEPRALIQALDAGQVLATAFDGKYHEDIHNKRLRGYGLDRFVQFPRTAWLTAESYDRIAAMCFQSVGAYTRGVEIPYLVLDN